jgi:pyruvate/2-oxoglutarate/acetoin dehydrogenase E1 component
MYFKELARSMRWLAEQDHTIFLGQAVEVPGTAMFNTLTEVNPDQKVEIPVAEEMQMGMAIGLAMGGLIPITIYPRWNFLLLAVNQLVNHLDRIAYVSNREYLPKVIIRTSIGSERPLHPQHQHVGDFTDAFRLMLNSVEVIRLDEPEEIFPAYQKAYERPDGRSTLIVEYGDYYNEK